MLGFSFSRFHCNCLFFSFKIPSLHLLFLWNGYLMKLIESIMVAGSIIILICFLAASLRVFSFCRLASPSNMFWFAYQKTSKSIWRYFPQLKLQRLILHLWGAVISLCSLYVFYIYCLLVNNCLFVQQRITKFASWRVWDRRAPHRHK